MSYPLARPSFHGKRLSREAVIYQIHDAHTSSLLAHKAIQLAAMTQIIDIAVQTKGWPDCDALAMRAVSAAAAQLESPRIGELSLVLSDDAQIQVLNKTFREKDTPTNVLSFPQSGPLLGDIILARETLFREASEKNISFEAHLAHLIIHGWLHLQGFDHQTEETATEMEAIEIAALATLAIDNPYQVSDD